MRSVFFIVIVFLSRSLFSFLVQSPPDRQLPKDLHHPGTRRPYRSCWPHTPGRENPPLRAEIGTPQVVICVPAGFTPTRDDRLGSLPRGSAPRPEVSKELRILTPLTLRQTCSLFQSPWREVGVRTGTTPTATPPHPHSHQPHHYIQGKNLPEPHNSTAGRNPSHHTDWRPPTGKRASRIRFPVQKSCCLRASRWRQHDSIRGKRPDSAGAHEVVLWHLAVQEEAVDGCGDALVAADVGDMGITVPGQQLGGVELLG